MFYKKGDDWIVYNTITKQELGRHKTKGQAALQHYTELEPHKLKDFKDGKLVHREDD